MQGISNPKTRTQEILRIMLKGLMEGELPPEVKEKLKAVDWNIDALTKIAAFGANDYETMKESGMSPHKGLLTLGPIGSGKTEAMLKVRQLTKPGFKHENMFDIMLNFNTKGDAALLPFRHGPKFSSTQLPMDCFFDDLGVERTGSYFGTKAEIGIDLIYMRHLLFKKTGAKSHFTTNMNIEELTTNYKDISRSRLREMCNLVQFSKNAPDLRF